MKNILLFTLTILMVKSINAQVVSDSIHMNPGYTHQVFYQLSSQTKTHAPFNGAGGWDLGFEVTLMNAAVISNPNSIVVYKVPNGDSAKYASLSYAGYDSWEVLYNTDTSWEKGAFNIQANSSNPFDFGWGTYDFTTHAVFGDSIYLIDKGGVLYKFWIRKKTATGDYIIRYADLTNGGSDVDVTIPAATYGTKNFVYFNIDNQSILDIEPATSDWDVVFNHYITQIPYLGAYPVTGVQSNFGVAVAKAYPVDVTTVSYLDYSSSLSKQLSVIGYDWKTYDFSINQYVLEDSLIYFVKSKNNAVNSLRFTDFDNVNGIIYFETNALVSSINEVNSNITQASVYPNPSKEFATIVYDSKLNSETKIQLFDLAGRKYYESSFNSKSGLNAQTISLPSLADGLYHMILSAGNEKLNFKLVVAQ